MKTANKPSKVTKTPLGSIQLANGEKKIFPMNDFFLNFTFKDESNWETLRQIINIFIEAYQKHNPDTLAKKIDGNITVETQYQYLLDIQNTTRDQHIKIIENSGDTTYIEFQNRANIKKPIPERAVEYFGLGIGHSKGMFVNQIWLLAKDVESVLNNEMFARHIWTNEVTHNAHPNTSGILYVSLSQLSKKDCVAGELAKFLLGKISDAEKELSSEIVKQVARQFSVSFDIFKADKGVTTAMLVKDRFIEEGHEETTIEIALEMARDGMSVEKIAKYTKTSLQWVEELIASAEVEE